MNDLKTAGAFYAGEHFVLKSGKHSEAYINPDVALTDPYIMAYVTDAMAEPFKCEQQADLVCVGPAFGGNYLAWDVARKVGEFSGFDVKWIATAKSPEGGFIIEPDRGFEKLLIGSNVLVVEDLLTTGGSVMELIESLKRYGDFNLIGVTVAVNRGGVTAEDLGVPRLHAAAEISIETDVPGNCRWCAMSRPIVTDIGHGAEFAAKNPGYPGGFKELLAA
ncbi:MAG TPA: phosphoribosyltransferase family protein [Candidatus Saccharimonadales bacterium]|nr:phosphoribosyltransferase family protein [Candidatus Saccharimonadales bacterium]